MHARRNLTALTIVLKLTILLWAVLASAQRQGLDLERSRFTVSAGFLLSGDVELDSPTVDSRSAYSLGACFDIPIGNRFFLALSIDLHRQDWKGPWEDLGRQAEGTLADLGLGLKRLIYLGESRFALRPGVGIGFASLGNMLVTRGSNYLTASGTTDLIYMVSEQIGLMVEVGGWLTLAGSDNDQDITLGPMPLIRLGVVF